MAAALDTDAHTARLGVVFSNIQLPKWVIRCIITGL